MRLVIMRTSLIGRTTAWPDLAHARHTSRGMRRFGKALNADLTGHRTGGGGGGLLFVAQTRAMFRSATSPSLPDWLLIGQLVCYWYAQLCSFRLQRRRLPRRKLLPARHLQPAKCPVLPPGAPHTQLGRSSWRGAEAKRASLFCIGRPLFGWRGLFSWQTGCPIYPQVSVYSLTGASRRNGRRRRRCAPLSSRGRPTWLQRRGGGRCREKRARTKCA